MNSLFSDKINELEVIMNKPIYLLVFLVLILSCTTNTSRKEPKKKGESWAVNDQGDSTLYRYSDKSILMSYSPFKEGKKHGIAKKFYADGKTEFEISYANGLKEGITKWYYESGQLYKETNYKRGLREGIVIKYYRNGKLKAEEPYKNGMVMPGLKEYTKEGKLKKIYPTITITPIDNLSFGNLYILRCSLSNKAKSVKFYRMLKFDNQNLKEEIATANGVADFEYNVPRGGYYMNKEIIRAEFKTVLSNTYVIEREYNLALDN